MVAVKVGELRRIVREEVLREADLKGPRVRVALFVDEPEPTWIVGVLPGSRQELLQRGVRPEDALEHMRGTVNVGLGNLFDKGLLDDAQAGDPKAEMYAFSEYLSSMTPPVELVAHTTGGAWDPFRGVGSL